jgi:hypothetical protein
MYGLKPVPFTLRPMPSTVKPNTLHGRQERRDE